jgi:ADP-ribose pyrophosphatase
MAEWLEQTTVYEGAILSVKSGRVLGGGGRVVDFDIVEHNGGVAVAPLLGRDVLLVSQPRIVIGENLLELPAGKLERGDLPEARARTELEEETGYRAGRLEKAAEFYVSPGYTTERILIYLAFDLEFVGEKPETTEEIELVRLPLEDVRRMLDDGRFRDAKTIIGLRQLIAFLDRN